MADDAAGLLDMLQIERVVVAGYSMGGNLVLELAGEQAGFSSAREMTCRIYLKEDFHEYCALRLTQARALALQAAIFEQGKSKADLKPAKALEGHTVAKRKPAARQKPDNPPGQIRILRRNSNPQLPPNSRAPSAGVIPEAIAIVPLRVLSRSLFKWRPSSSLPLPRRRSRHQPWRDPRPGRNKRKHK